MLSILDLVPQLRPVVISQGEIAVTGLPLGELLALVGRYPVLKDALFGAATGTEELLNAAPEALAAVVASAVGQAGQPEYEAAAAAMTLGDQLAIIAACLALTLPDGIGPFVAAIEKVAGVKVKTPATT